MNTRDLTGCWYLKKKFFGGYTVMVEIFYYEYVDFIESELTEKKVYVKATDLDLKLLKINVK